MNMIDEVAILLMWQVCLQVVVVPTTEKSCMKASLAKGETTSHNEGMCKNLQWLVEESLSYSIHQDKLY